MSTLYRLTIGGILFATTKLTTLYRPPLKTMWKSSFNLTTTYTT